MELFQCTGTVLNSALKLKIPYVKTVQKGNFLKVIWILTKIMLQVYTITCIYTKKNKIMTDYKMLFSQSHKPKTEFYCG